MKTVSAKISNDEYQLMSEIAKSHNITISTLIKQSIFEAKIQDKSIEKERLYQLNRIGNNLNQIARKLNQKKLSSQLALEELIAIRNELQNDD